MKAFYGQKVLQRLDGVAAPLFGVADKSNMFFGFFDHRLFLIEIVNWGEEPARTQLEITALGIQAIGAGQQGK
jgi:hypothetical protein